MLDLNHVIENVSKQNRKCCFRPLFCTRIGLNGAKGGSRPMRQKGWMKHVTEHLPGIEPRTPWFAVQCATTELRPTLFRNKLSQENTKFNINPTSDPDHVFILIPMNIYLDYIQQYAEKRKQNNISTLRLSDPDLIRIESWSTSRLIRIKLSQCLLFKIFTHIYLDLIWITFGADPDQYEDRL